MPLLTAFIKFLFGPQMGRIRDWELRADPEGFDEQGSIGVPQRKRYRDALDRHWAEEARRASWEQVLFRLRSAENTVHSSSDFTIR